jgi:hypothetical protein
VLDALSEQALVAGDIAVVRVRFEDLGDAGRASAQKGASATEQASLEWAVGMLLEAATASGLEVSPSRDRAAEVLATSEDVLVLIDGLDEVSDLDRRTFARKIAAVLAGRPGAKGAWEGGLPGRMVMASRVTGYARPAEGIEELLVPPLGEGRRRSSCAPGSGTETQRGLRGPLRPCRTGGWETWPGCL